MQISLSDHFTYQKLLRFVAPSILMMIITSYNNNYGLRRGSQPRLFPSQSRSC